MIICAEWMHEKNIPKILWALTVIEQCTTMVRQGREKLSGIVEIDEAYIGGEESGKGKRFQ